ncbi:MAG TPA: cyclic nucleotide-binding domain-containing protein [Candidatus Binatia bacterium]|nr:cyclic nucleotide-binding domain-containing protein [Candidatus Binatia bacterium]
MEQRRLATIEKVIFLKSVDIFSHATVEELGRVAALTEEVHFEPGETIFRQGEPTDAIYLILAGRVTIESNGRIVREITDRQAFGTVAALDRNPAVHTLKAMDAVHALKLSAQDFDDILSVDFECVRSVLRALCRLIREGR